MAVRYVIFDLDDTLVHSDAVRRAFCDVAIDRGFAADRVNAVCDVLPGRPALEIFEGLGLSRDEAADDAVRFLARLEALDEQLPAVAYPDAAATLRAVRARGAQLILSTGSSPERAHRVLAQAGWGEFALVLGSAPAQRKGAAHFAAMAEHAGARQWTGEAAAVGDSPADMRLAVDHGVPVRIGIQRGREAAALLAEGATHVVQRLADIVPILAAAA